MAVDFVPRTEYRGFSNVLHGGIVATELDEVLAWTAILVADTMAVAAKTELRFHNAAPATGRYALEGTLVEQRGRRLLMEAQCEVEGTLIAEAKALFIATETIEEAVKEGEFRTLQSPQGKTDTSTTPSRT